jgi:hypothetical protein
MTTPPVLYFHSGDGGVSKPFQASVDAGHLLWKRQTDITVDDIAKARGIILPHAVDQIALMDMRDALEGFLDLGGRLILHCHVLREFIKGLENFIPMDKPKRPDFELLRVAKHQIFGEYPTSAFASCKGVVGFYGRGHNPMPINAQPIQVFGEKAIPVDWQWQRPNGGTVFSHSGNNLWVVGDFPEVRHAMAGRVVTWCMGEA